MVKSKNIFRALGLAFMVPLLCAVPTVAQTVAASAPALAASVAEVGANPYGFEALWSGSDLVAKAVLILLFLMSAGSWYILVVKWLEQAKMGILERQHGG